MELDDKKLTQIPLFLGISRENLRPMLHCLGCYQRTYGKNELIYLENEEIRAVGIVLSGIVHMVKQDREGNQTLLVCIRAGELFGETFSCGSGIGARVSFVTASPSTVLFLPFHRVLHTCKMTCRFHHRLIENMVQQISEKNVRLIEKIAVISQKTLRGKILAYLRMQAEQQGSREVVVPLGRLELAEYLCADRSAMSRELSRMKRDGLIDFTRNRFRLCTPPPEDVH